MSERTPEEWLDAMCHGDYCGDELGRYDEALAAWEADRARIATLTAQRDALVPLARWALGIGTGATPEAKEQDAAARAALAAIAAEQTTTTGEGK
jgi:hypothetical protein